MKSKPVTIKYPIMGVNFNTPEEAIAILKNNPNQTRIDWINFFGILLGDIKQEYKELFMSGKFTEDQFFNKMIQGWEAPYNDYIPTWTREEFWNLIDNTPAFTEQDIRQRYTKEQLDLALSYLNKKEKNIMKKVWRIYQKTATRYDKNKNNFLVLDSHYLTVQETNNKKHYMIFRLPISNMFDEIIEFPNFNSQDEAIDFMIKYEIEGFVALTVE